MQPLAIFPDRLVLRVSILTRPESRMQQDEGLLGDASKIVSILTRPESRMQPSGVSSSSRCWVFQSSPGPKAGCNSPGMYTRWLCHCFNPHPARKPDATLKSSDTCRAEYGFQSSPGPKAGCNPSKVWMPPKMMLFQSSPGPKAGCNTISLDFIR